MEELESQEFHALVLRELDAVYRLAYHLTLSTDKADDLVQETYLRALKSRASFRTTERGPRPWLLTILHNIHKTRMGRAARDPSDSESLDEQPAAEPDPLPDSIDWEQVDERLKNAMEALPTAHRTVLLLWAVEGLSYKQIAEVTDVPIGTVMSRLYRARQALAGQVFDLGVEQRLVTPGSDGQEKQAPEDYPGATSG